MVKRNRGLGIFALIFWAILLGGIVLSNQAGLVGLVGFGLWVGAIIAGAIFFLSLTIRRARHV